MHALLWEEDMTLSEENRLLNSMIVFLYETCTCTSICTEQLKK